MIEILLISAFVVTASYEPVMPVRIAVVDLLVQPDCRRAKYSGVGAGAHGIAE